MRIGWISSDALLCLGGLLFSLENITSRAFSFSLVALNGWWRHGTVENVSLPVLCKIFAFAVATNKETRLGQRPGVNSPFSLCCAAHIKFPLEKPARVFWNLIQYENNWRSCLKHLHALSLEIVETLEPDYNQTGYLVFYPKCECACNCMCIDLIFKLDLSSHGEQLSMRFLRVIMRIHDARSKTSCFSSWTSYWMVQSNVASRAEVLLWY